MVENPGRRAALPHDNEIAVDGDRSTKVLYLPIGEYHRQFRIRQDTTVEHIQAASKGQLGTRAGR
jgi:hypothetical protein